MSEPTIIASPPPAPETEPTGLTSKHAMWVGTLLLVGCIILAGLDVKKFYQLWIDGWWGILAACGFIIGVKPTKDIMLAAVNRPKVIQ